MFIFKQVAGNREAILWIFTSEFKDSIFLGGGESTDITECWWNQKPHPKKSPYIYSFSGGVTCKTTIIKYGLLCKSTVLLCYEQYILLMD